MFLDKNSLSQRNSLYWQKSNMYFQQIYLIVKDNTDVFFQVISSLEYSNTLPPQKSFLLGNTVRYNEHTRRDVRQNLSANNH